MAKKSPPPARRRRLSPGTTSVPPTLDSERNRFTVTERAGVASELRVKPAQQFLKRGGKDVALPDARDGVAVWNLEKEGRASAARGASKAVAHKMADCREDCGTDSGSVRRGVPVVHRTGQGEEAASGGVDNSIVHGLLLDKGMAGSVRADLQTGDNGGCLGGDSHIGTEQLVKQFREFVIRRGTEENCGLYNGLDEDREWLKVVEVCRSSGQQVVLDVGRSPPRFLLYDAISDYLVLLGTSVHEAVTHFNFPKLSNWRLIDDDTGDALDYSAADPFHVNMESRDAQEWRTLADGVSFALDNYATGVIGPAASRIAEIVKSSDWATADAWLIEGPEFDETLKLSNLRSGTVRAVTEQIRAQIAELSFPVQPSQPQ